MDEIEKLYRSKYSYRVKLMTKILKGDQASAEDIVQTAFERAIKYRKSFNPELGALDAWFNTILFRALRDHQRDVHGRYNEICMDLHESLTMAVDSPEWVREAATDFSDVENPIHREVLRLRLVLEFTPAEISQILEVTPTNVNTIVNRWRATKKEKV